jgi:CubicO group peptidase (beta-lactamase class C family)
LPAWRPLYRQPANAIRDIVLNSFFSYPTAATVVYSDLGFILLGWAIEQLTGERLDRALREWVLSPLDLTGIQYRPLRETRNDEAIDNEQCAPTEYCGWRGRRIQGEVHDENAWAIGGIAGHAGLFGSAAAVADLGQAWLASLNGTSDFLPQWLAQEATRQQAATDTVRRGLGWALWSADLAAAIYPLSRESFGHSGFTGTSLHIDPQRQLVISCLTNEVYFGRHNRTIASFRLALNELIVGLS